MQRAKAKPLQEVIKVAGEVKYFTNIMDCPVCNAKSKKGRDIRLDIDKLLITKEPKEVHQVVLETYDLNITEIMLKNHLYAHSRYLLEEKDTVIKAAEKHALNQ